MRVAGSAHRLKVIPIERAAAVSNGDDVVNGSCGHILPVPQTFLAKRVGAELLKPQALPNRPLIE
jgi:hypothetical protein